MSVLKTKRLVGEEKSTEESREDGCKKTGCPDGEGCMTAPGVSRRDEKLTGEEKHRSGEAREGCLGGGAQRAT
jgi:hypothetical protein